MAIQQGEILDNTLEIISEKYKNNNRYFYKCKCLKCGKEFDRSAENIMKNKKMCKNCSDNLWKYKFIDQKFEYCITTDDINQIIKKHNRWYVKCLCVCGNSFYVRTDILFDKKLMNCGCITDKIKKQRDKYNKDKRKNKDLMYLFNVYPHLKEKWDFENDVINPDTCSCIRGDIKLNWICPNGHRYEPTIMQQIYSQNNCPYCLNKKILTGYNDLWSKRADLRKNIVDENVAKNILEKDQKNKIWCKCDTCGNLKQYTPYTLSKKGFYCERCRDGISYGEKFIISLLQQLNIDFINQKRFPWSQNKIYDFYIPKCKCIIEINGAQHYREWELGRSLKEEQLNDRHKFEMAINNGIANYIIIKNIDNDKLEDSIVTSDISKLFDLSSIDYAECHRFAMKNICKDVLEYFNTHKCGATLIQKQFPFLCVGTIGTYLKKGNKLGLCVYNKSNKNFYESIKVKCIDNNTVYSSISECCKSLDIARRTFDRYKNQYGDRFICKNYQIQIINE